MGRFSCGLPDNTVILVQNIFIVFIYMSVTGRKKRCHRIWLVSLCANSFAVKGESQSIQMELLGDDYIKSQIRLCPCNPKRDEDFILIKLIRLM